MEKLIKITCCDMCLHFNSTTWRCGLTGWENDDNNLEIPDWCPLPDEPENEKLGV